MANPYGITEVNIPGILSAYQDRQDRRFNQMLVQRKMAAEDRALEQQSALAKAYGSLKLPGTTSASGVSKGGDQASGVGGAYAPPASPDTGDLSSGVSLAYAPKVTPEMQAQADKEYGPATAPETPVAQQQITPQDQSWLQANGDVIKQVMGIAPEQGLALYKQLQGMDDEQLKKTADAQTAMANIAYSLRNVPYQQRRSVLQSSAPMIMRQHPGLTPQMIAGFDPTDQNLDMFAGQAIGVKGMIDHSMEERKQGETERHNRATEGAASAGLGIRERALNLAGQREGRIAAGGGKGGSGGDVSGMSSSDLIRMATGN